MTAADGKTTRYRYDVDAILYAPNRETAQRRIDESSIYYNAAVLNKEEHGPS